MAKNLVIVESPAKAKSINKILGTDYQVKASMGHVRDLPEKKLGVDIENEFEPQYVPVKGRQKVLKELEAEAKKSDAVYLAPDPDREGEAIAWHLEQALAKSVPEDQFYRVSYNEITAPAIRRAFENPSRIDINKVNSQQARRILDRIVGYRVSPLLWRRTKGGASAGRVQSVALRLVCEREDEIDKFEPSTYFVMGARVCKEVDPRDPFDVRLVKIDGEKAEIGTAEEAESIQHDLNQRRLRVDSIAEKDVSRKPRPPFITSTLQQAASSVFGFTPSRTMRIAQSLYEGVDFGEGPVGVITYMRTDAPAVSREAQSACRALVEEQYGNDYLPETPPRYRSRGGAQEAHEAIRPTDVRRTPDSLARILKPDELKLYRLIWQRFVASQMAPATIRRRTVEVEADPGERGPDNPRQYRFRATASEIVFPGWMKATGEDQRKKKKGPDETKNGEEDDEADSLPPLTEQERLECLEWLSEEKQTQPPPRYSEAALVRAMEENGVGRPSTYAQILSTLYNRDYVQREKRSLRPTQLGREVNQFLVENLSRLFDTQFTAQMEESLDKIESGDVEWTDMLSRFYRDFAQWVEQAKGPAADTELVRALLDRLDTVQEWAPPQKRGKRTYSDEKFVTSIREQLDKGEKAISQRQLDALKKLACRYRDQIPGLLDEAGDLGLQDFLQETRKEEEPPKESTRKKLALMQPVEFQEPRKVGKRVYDDKAFVESLGERVEQGRRLTDNQVRALDKIVQKYAAQIPDFEQRAEELGLAPAEQTEDHESGPLLALMENVSEWNPPVQRGKREWDDKKFYESLKRQYAQKKSLSDKQRATLKKMIARYAAQIPDYEQKADEMGLPPPKTPGAKKGS